MDRDYFHHEHLEMIFAEQPRPKAVTFEHPRNKAERADWAKLRASIEDEGYEIYEVASEHPERPEYRIEFETRDDQMAFIIMAARDRRSA